MQRISKDLLRCPLFDDLPGIHDTDPVSDVGVHAHIVRDQDDRILEILLDRFKHLNHAALYDHIQCCGGLIANHDARFQQGGQCDGHALAHPSRQLVWVELEDIFG